MTKLVCIAGALLAAIGAGANGLFMLLAPRRWYLIIPGVPATGPFNQHFVRDIGLTFLLIAASFVAGAKVPRHRVILWAFPSLWLFGHALFHLWEVADGMSPRSSIGRDFAAITLPAVIGLALTLWAWKVDKTRSKRAAAER